MEPRRIAEGRLHRVSTVTPGAAAARTCPITMPSAPLAIRPETPVRALALHVEGAWRVLGERHIDYCCRSERSLREACERAGIDPHALIAQLEAERARTRVHGAAAETHWTDHAPWELVEHLLETHHPLAWRELERLGALMDEVLRAHGEVPELMALADLLVSLRAELEPHLMKEERVLFPWVMSLRVHEAEGTTPDAPSFGHPSHPIRVMRADHDTTGELLHRMREVTNRYVPPDSASAAWRALYEGLDALDRDLMRHISLENDVLFPMLLEQA